MCDINKKTTLCIISRLFMSDFVDFATMVGYTRSNIVRSDGASMVLNGSNAVFSDLEPNKRYLLEYFSNATVGRISVDATAAIRFQINKGSGYNYLGSSSIGTVRAQGSGADEVILSINMAACFEGVSTITAQTIAGGSGTQKYDNGNMTAILYEVPKNDKFPTNI